MTYFNCFFITKLTNKAKNAGIKHSWLISFFFISPCSIRSRFIFNCFFSIETCGKDFLLLLFQYKSVSPETSNLNT